MLVLTRKIDESIMIGDEIKITVVGVRGDQVKLGIEAPRQIPVHREEIFREIQEENRRAALQAGPDAVERERLSHLTGSLGASPLSPSGHPVTVNGEGRSKQGFTPPPVPPGAGHVPTAPSTLPPGAPLPPG